MILLILAMYIFIGVYEFVPLYKQRMWPELWVNTVLTVASFTVAMLLNRGIKIPSPEAPIREVITSIFGK